MSETKEDKHIDELTLDDFVPSRDEIVFFGVTYIISRLMTILSYWTTKQLIKLCNGKVNTRTRAIKKITDYVRFNMKRRFYDHTCGDVKMILEAKSQPTADTQK